MDKILIPLLVVVLLGGGTIAAILVGKKANETLCEAINGNRATVRNLLIAARNQTPKRRLTKRAKKFYRSQIEKIKPLDCAEFNKGKVPELRDPEQHKKKGGDAPTAGTKPKSPP